MLITLKLIKYFLNFGKDQKLVTEILLPSSFKTCASLELINQGKLEGSKVIYRAAINQLLTLVHLKDP